MSLDRRQFLSRTGVVAAGGLLLGGPFAGLVAGPASAATVPAHKRLRAVPDLRDGKVRLHLPKGFSYRSFDDTEAGATTSDGTPLPGRHDGMAAFPGAAGSVVLVRNHEINGVGAPMSTTAPLYDPMARGGTTTVRVTPSGEVLASEVSLAGTMMNCSGGAMPWGSWLTCEETVNGPDVGPDFTRAPNVALTQPHGFVFEVPVDGTASGAPVRSAGRFAHESAVYSPEDGAVYLTEDNFGFPSGFYRYLPPSDPMAVGRLEDGGRLQMLAVRGLPNADLAASQRQRATYDVEWVDIDEPWREFAYTPGQPAPPRNDDALNFVGGQGRAKGAALFSRLEGAVADRGVVWFTSTQGGGPAEAGLGPIADGFGNGRGQVWGYHVASGKLQLLHQAAGDLTRADGTDMDMPDNITTSRRGTLVVCEDGSGDNLLRGLTRGGQLHDIALNRLRSAADAPRFGEEFAGASFSPNGDTLFVNIQASNGLTFAIWGPWERIGV